MSGIIQGSLNDIIAGVKPENYGENRQLQNLLSDTKGLLADAKGKKNMLVKADEMLQRLVNMKDTIGLINGQTIEDELRDLTYGKIDDFYQRTMNKFGSKLDKVDKFIDRGLSIIGHVSSLFGLRDNAIIANAKTAYAKVFKSLDAEFLKKIAGKDPIQTGIYFGELGRFYMEDLGVVYDEVKSIEMTREYHCVFKPSFQSDMTGKIRSYVFFTRPNLNVFERGDSGELVAAPELLQYDTLRQLALSDPALYSELCREGCNKTPLFTFLNNYCIEVPAIRVNESSRDGIRNRHGGMIPLPGKPENVGVDISVTFSDNARADVAKLLYFMKKYSTYVAEEGYAMRKEYIKNQAIDSLMSMYMVTVDTNWRIIGFGFACYLTLQDTPTHFTQHKAEGFDKPDLLDNFTVTFKALEYDAHAPEYYDYFNWLSNFDPANVVDTRGSALTLQEVTRDVQTGRGHCPARTSVWSANNGMKGYGPNIPTVSPSFVTNKVHATTFPRNFDFCRYRHRGVGEMLARNPGVYVSVNSNDPYRRIFKFGFSY